MSDVLGNRIEDGYLPRLLNDPELMEEVEGKLVAAIFYAAEAISITMSSDQWDAVLVLMREGRRAHGAE